MSDPKSKQEEAVFFAVKKVRAGVPGPAGRTDLYLDAKLELPEEKVRAMWYAYRTLIT